MKPITFGSVCSGIEAASVAWEPLGWKAAWLSEIEPFPCAVLAQRFPYTPNLGDMRDIADKVRAGEVPAPDVFTGGTPCQAFSVAGSRNSLADERGNLTLTFTEIANAIDDKRNELGQQPAVIIWENVPGVLNTKDNAFGCFLAELAGLDEPLCSGSKNGKWASCGYVAGPRRQVVWRVLDAQHFGVAQRRRRVFVVASAGDLDLAKVLIEQKGVRGAVAPLGGTGQEVAETPAGRSELEAGPAGVVKCFTRSYFERGVGPSMSDLVPTLTARGNGDTRPLLVGNFELYDFPKEQVSPTLNAQRARDCIAYGEAGVFECHGQDSRVKGPLEVAPTVVAKYGTGGGNTPIVCRASLQANAETLTEPRYILRRLTPTECERLQGFPDGWTAINWKGKSAENCPEAPRYKALGNSWAVPVARWVGARVAAVIENKEV